MKKTLKQLIRQSYGTLALTAVFILLAVLLLMHIQTLSSKITLLETQIASSTEELKSYEASRCANTFGVTQSNTVSKYSIQVAGVTRTYQVHTPNNYDPLVRTPVVLSFDGIDGSGSQMESYSGLDPLPAIVVYPDSLAGTQGYTAWQGAPYSLDGEYDVAFVRQILQDIPKQYCVDSSKVFAVGMSNGGAFATIVGCKLGNQIQAVASVSGAYYTNCQREERTPSLLVLHSTDDNRVPYKGATTRGLPEIPMWVNQQASERNCKVAQPTITVNSTVYTTWLDCADNSMVRFVSLQGQMHGWLKVPQSTALGEQSTAGYIWKFFEESTHL